jgi:MFS family permease
MRAYLDVLRNKRARHMLIAAFPARLAYGMVGLDLYFKVHDDTHSIALAGIAAGVNGLFASVSTGVRSSVIARVGSMLALRFFVPAYALMLLAVNACHGATLLILAAGILGITAPPINLSVRPMWKTAVPEKQYRAAVAVDTASLNTGVILGPVLATTLSLSSHPSIALVATSLFCFSGGISLSLLDFTKKWRPDQKEEGAPSLFQSPGIQLLLAEAVLIGFGTGTYQIGIPAISSLHKMPRFAGLAFGLGATLSILGSLIAGTLGKHILPVRGFRVTYLFWFLTTIPFMFSNPGWSLLLASSLFGFISGAEQVFYLEMLEFVRPPGSAVTALGWIWTTEGSFTAIGQSFGGYVSEHRSPHTSFLITTIMFALGLMVIHLGRGRLKPGHSSVSS